MKTQLNQIVRIVTALACLTLLGYVITTQNIAYYQPYIGAACVLSTWLTMKYNRVWGSVSIMLALALCWQFEVLMSWEGVLLGLTMTSAASAALLLLPEALLIRTYATTTLNRRRPVAPPQYGDRQPHQDSSAPATQVDVEVQTSPA